MMRLACVPFPAPGGPSNTTGPTSREVSCAIELAKASRTVFPGPPTRRPRCSNPKFFLYPRGYWHHLAVTGLSSWANSSCARIPKTHRRKTYSSRPVAAAANTSAARRKSVVVPHDELRLNLRHSIHGHAHHDQQRGSTKIKIHSQTIRHPHWKPLK